MGQIRQVCCSIQVCCSSLSKHVFALASLIVQTIYCLYQDLYRNNQNELLSVPVKKEERWIWTNMLSYKSSYVVCNSPPYKDEEKRQQNDKLRNNKQRRSNRTIQGMDVMNSRVLGRASQKMTTQTTCGSVGQIVQQMVQQYTKLSFHLFFTVLLRIGLVLTNNITRGNKRVLILQDKHR